MDWLNIIGKYMDRQPKGSVNPGFQHVAADSVHRDFDLVSQRAPRSVLAEALSDALRSPDTAPFSETVARLFSHATPDQRVAVLNTILSIAPDAVRGDVAALFGRNREVTEEDVRGVSPSLVRRVAGEAEQRDGTVVDRISDILAGHPRLLKNLDVATLSTAMARIGEIMSGRRTMRGGGGA